MSLRDEDGNENGRNTIGLTSKTIATRVDDIFSTDFFPFRKNQYEGQVFVYFVKAAFGCITFPLH